MQFLNFRRATKNELAHFILSCLILTACINDIPFKLISLLIAPDILFTSIITIALGGISAVRILMTAVDFFCYKYIYHRDHKAENTSKLHLLSIHNYKENIEFHEGEIVKALFKKIDNLIENGHNITINSHLLKIRHIKQIELYTKDKFNNCDVIIDVNQRIPLHSRLIIKGIFIFFYWYIPKVKKTGKKIYISNTKKKAS